MRIVVLGAGFGGLEIATRLSAEFGEELDLVLVDKSDHFVFGFSKLDVMFGRTTSDAVCHHYRDIVKPGVRFLQTTIRSIDPVAKRVVTDAETLDADVLVVALGADLNPAATPGLDEDGGEFYTVPGAFALRERIAAFDGGNVIVAVTSTPFKCPPAPSECALLMDDYLRRRGIRDAATISLVMPLPKPIPPSPQASAALLEAFAARGIDWYPERLVREVDASRKVVHLSDGANMPYDLLLAAPQHRVPEVVRESGLAVDGWVPVDRITLETSFPDVYAIGDVTSVGTPKAGVFAEGQGAVVAERIAARLRSSGAAAEYDGLGICYLDFGNGEVALVDVRFLAGTAPSGSLQGPSVNFVADKVDFGASRVRRWFGRDWTPT